MAEEDDPHRKGLVVFGTDVSKIPCFRDTFMYSIGSAMGVGLVYNLSTSRNPTKLVVATYSAVTFGYWFVCRYRYRQNEHNMKGLKAAMTNYAYLEGTEKDEEWARQCLDKKTEVRNFRSDALPKEEDLAK